MRPSKDQCVDARKEILAAAEKCFGAAGYAGTSVQDIIDETRFSKPVIYYHFGNKAGLFQALMEEAYDQSYTILEDGFQKAGPVRERLIDTISTMFELHQRRRSRTRLAFYSAFAAPQELPVSDRLVELRERHLQLFRNLIEEGRRIGELDEALDATSLTFGIYGAISFHLMSDLALRPEAVLDRKAAERMVDLYLKGAAAVAA